VRAARLVGPGRFELEERDAPAPGAGEVLVRVAGCGVCASNLRPWEGTAGVSYPLEPGAPGHEVYGRIEALGPGAAGLAVGDPVVALSYHGFAELDIASADAVVTLPSALANRPVLGEPLACAVNIADRSGIRDGDTVVVLGTGFLGSVLVCLARRASARVVAVSRRPESLDAAGRMGAHELLTYADDVAGRVSALTGGAMADVVIECTGRQEPLDLGAVLTRVRGRLVIAGYHQDGSRTVNMQLWNWRGLDVINAHERAPARYTSGMRKAVQLVQEGVLDPESLISHYFPLSAIDTAFQAAAARGASFLKAVILPGD
jgi:NADPH:quinone reductase